MITYNLSNLCPSSFHMMSRDNTFFGPINLSHPSTDTFRQRDNNTMLSTLLVMCVCVSEAPVFIWYLLRPSQPLSSFLGDVSRTAWQHCNPCFWHGQLYVACSGVGNRTNIYIPAPEGKTTSVTFRTEGIIPISLHAFTFTDTFTQFIPSPCFCYIIHKIANRFRHWSSRATPDTPANTVCPGLRENVL
jgi:hypothetical protein